MKRALPVLIVGLLLGTFGLGQTRQITGKITTAPGEPVSFASVKIKGKNVGVSADANGNYRISAGQGDVLVVSATTILTREVKVGTENILNIEVTTRNAELSEVVVTALGISRESRSLGYSAQKVGGDEITRARETNIVNSLAGKVAGVRVTSQSGTVGGASRIIIRGVTSLYGSSQPLFVIDGLPIDNGSPVTSTVSGTAPTGSSSVDFGNRAADINPDDVESMSVLKGATATALYGSRAKNGAIIITTKKGKKGRNAVSFNSSVRFDNVLKLPDFQNEYAQGNNGTYSLNSTNGWGPKISEVQDQQFPDFLGDMVTLKAYPDNVKNFYRTGHTYINSVAFEGGGTDNDFRLGYTNTVQDGVIPNESFVRNALSLNVGRTFSDKLNIRTNLSYISTNSKGRPTQSSNDPNVIVSLINDIPRTVDIDKLRANYFDADAGRQITLTPGRYGNNPFWVVNNNGYLNKVERAYGNVVLNYDLFKWLTLSNNLGVDFYNEFRRGVTRNGTVGRLSGAFVDANLYNRVINNDLLLTSTQKLGENLTAKFLAGGNINDWSFRNMQANAQDLIVDQLYTFANAGSVVPINRIEHKRILGLFGEIDLAYNDYLYLTLTGRNDWSSVLPKAHRSYFYPSVSAGFVFTEAIDLPSWLSYGKLRASWANVGSDDDPYQTDFYFNPQSSAYAQYGFGVNFPFNGALAYSIPTTFPAYDLKPQNQSSFELGTELHFLSNRVNLDFTYYRSYTSEQIVSLSKPNSTGYRSERINAGAVENKGIELQLGLVPVKTNNFTWNLGFNYSRNKQLVKDLPASLQSYTLASGWSSLRIKAEQGKEFGIYGTGWERDPDGNIVIDPGTGLRNTVSNVRLGDLYPDYMLGINNSFSYKAFNLSFLIDIRQGGVLYSGTVSDLRTSGLAKETLAGRGDTYIDDGVTETGGEYVKNTVPVENMQDYWESNFLADNTEANIFDASYVKFRELRLSYSIPSRYLSGRWKFVSSVELGLEARNLWIIQDHVPHIDPEVNFFANGPIGEGVEFGSIPSTRTWGFNLRFKF